MIRWIKKHPVSAVLLMDALLLPGIWILRQTVTLMFRQGDPCPWTLFGARCATCGGTHCVQSFLYGRFLEAFRWNPLVFCWILFAVATVLLLNIWVLLHQHWGGKALKVMYSMEAFFVAVGSYLHFAFWRNVPMLFERILERLPL